MLYIRYFLYLFPIAIDGNVLHVASVEICLTCVERKFLEIAFAAKIVSFQLYFYFSFLSMIPSTCCRAMFNDNISLWRGRMCGMESKVCECVCILSAPWEYPLP